MNKKASTYYNQIVYGNQDLKTICLNELNQRSQVDFQELYTNYIQELDEEFLAFDSVEDSKSYTKRYKMSKDQFKRVQIAMLILQTCAEGIPFSNKVMDSSIQYWNHVTVD